MMSCTLLTFSENGWYAQPNFLSALEWPL